MLVDGGVSLSLLVDLTCPRFLRERAVSLRASSSDLVGLEPLGAGLEFSVVERADGSIFPMNDHLFLVAETGPSIVCFGEELPEVLLETVASEWRLFA